MRPVRLFSWQLYTQQNYGDAILAEAIRYLFHAYGNRRCFRIDNGTDNRYPIGPRLIEFANTFDAGIIAGGGLIIPRNPTTSGWAFNSTVANARRLKRTIVFALGYNLYRRHDGLLPIFTRHFEAILENSPFVGLRDETSIDVVKELVDRRFHDRIVFQPCPTTFLPRLVEELDGSTWPARAKRVTFQISFEVENDNDRIASEVLDACRRLRTRGWVIELASFYAKPDLPIVEYLRSNGFTDFDLVEMNTEGRDMLKGPRHFADVPIVVASRGHGTMVPFGAGSLVIPVNVAPKVEQFARDVGISDRVIDIDDADLATTIVSSVERAHDEYDETQRGFQRHRERFYELSLDNLGRIHHAITGRVPGDPEVVPLTDFEVALSTRLHSKCVMLEGATRGPGARRA